MNEAKFILSSRFFLLFVLYWFWLYPMEMLYLRRTARLYSCPGWTLSTRPLEASESELVLQHPGVSKRSPIQELSMPNVACDALNLSQPLTYYLSL